MPIVGEKRRWRPWTPEDDMVLKKLYANSEMISLIQILDRSKETIRVRASFLNLKRSERASSLQKSRGAIQRRDNADAVDYQPIDIDEDDTDEMSSEVFGRYRLLATMKSNADVLCMCGQAALASLSAKILERIDAQAGLEFLTIHKGM